MNSDIKHAAQLLNQGDLVAFPTETVYGLGACFDNPEAIRKIYTIKGRPSNNPLIVHISHIDQLQLLIAGEISDQYQSLIDTIWPGPLTLIFPKNPSVLPEVTGGLDTVAIRMPRHPLALELIEETGKPLVAPSANPSGKPSATHNQHVYEYFGDEVYCLKGGFCTVGLESTVLIIKNNLPTILRAGVISPQDIENVIKTPVVIADHTDPTPLSPGMMYRHYAPEAKLQIAKDPTQIQSILTEYQHHPYPLGLLLSDETIQSLDIPFGVQVKSLGSQSRPTEISRNMYQTMIAFDHTDVEHIWTETFDTSGIGLAIMDKLTRASDSTTELPEQSKSK